MLRCQRKWSGGGICDGELKPEYKFCPSCGTPVSGQVSDRSGSRAAEEKITPKTDIKEHEDPGGGGDNNETLQGEKDENSIKNTNDGTNCSEKENSKSSKTAPDKEEIAKTGKSTGLSDTEQKTIKEQGQMQDISKKGEIVRAGESTESSDTDQKKSSDRQDVSVHKTEDKKQDELETVAEGMGTSNTDIKPEFVRNMTENETKGEDGQHKVDEEPVLEKGTSGNAENDPQPRLIANREPSIDGNDSDPILEERQDRDIENKLHCAGESMGLLHTEQKKTNQTKRELKDSKESGVNNNEQDQRSGKEQSENRNGNDLSKNGIALEDKINNNANKEEVKGTIRQCQENESTGKCGKARKDSENQQKSDEDARSDVKNEKPKPAKPEVRDFVLHKKNQYL